MAGRPRTPAKILELRGAFKKDPQRWREDLQGVGPFDPHPPANLPQEICGCWREIVKQIVPEILTASDVTSIETMARLLLQIRMTSDLGAIREFRQWCNQYGMTAVGRTKIPPVEKDPGGNPFARV